MTIDDELRFVLGVDLDGVCADFIGGLRPIAAEWLDVKESELTPTPTYNFPEWHLERVGGEEAYEKLHLYAITQRDIFRNLRPLQHAPVVLRRLAYVHKVRVRIITHRLFIPRFHETAINQTVEWLDKYGIPYWDLCFMKDKAGVGADLYIEDSPTNIKALRGTAMIRLSMPTQQMSALKARVQTTGSRSRSWSWKRLPSGNAGAAKSAKRQAYSPAVPDEIMDDHDSESKPRRPSEP